ncbi:hypothetical protein BRC81_12375 [Halobacteriales archaeon QS_1_68_20]|nr:MAG: hypothetical protein BRC81_12375 [Halobacteriales archaeon QS_1_68_20]
MSELLDSTVGRPRGPAGFARAWLTVILHPRRFFREAVVPGEQAPGLLFAMAVVAVAETSRLLLVADAVPIDVGPAALSAAFWLGAAVLLVTPATLHLVAALQTVLLVPFVSDRGGVSETVQVLGYATAPCALAGLPSPELRALVTIWGFVLLALGIGEVHGPRFEPAAALAAVPGAIVFGYGFRGFAAVETVLRQWYVI